MKELRVFHDKDGNIVWTHGLEGDGKFPTTIEEDLSKLPSATGCVMLTDSVKIDALLASSNGKVIGEEIQFGSPAPSGTPPFRRRMRLAQLLSMTNGETKPARVQIIEVETRQLMEFAYDAYITEQVKDLWEEAKLIIGDTVVVEFLEDNLQYAVVLDKIEKV